jgi:histidyl-tRNA synthetase
MYQPLKGMRDFFPTDMRRRQRVLDTVESVFKNYGYERLETPVLEDFDLLSKKSGEDTRQEIYCFKDKGDREIGLRFDLTVPTCRVVAANSDIPKPFKRYAIGRVWRYDNPGAGRYREFWQADVDVFGSGEACSDAEVVAVAMDCFRKLGFKDFTVRISNRKIIEGFVLSLGIKEDKIEDVFRSIDKLEKMGETYVTKELVDKGFKSKAVDELLAFIGLKGWEDVLRKAEESVKGNKVGEEGIAEMKAMVEALKSFDCADNVVIDMSLVRGLAYYTGAVFEVAVEGGKWSLAGGGRYDKLIEMFGGKPTPATGISLGIERILVVMDEKGMFGKDDAPCAVFVACAKEDVRKETLQLAQRLRGAGASVDADLMSRALKKQFDYVNAKGIPYCIVVGPREVSEKKYTLRDMVSGKEEKLTAEQLSERFKAC